MTKRLSEAQIIGLLCEAEAGLPVNQTRLGTLSQAEWIHDHTYATNRNGSRSRPIIRSMIFEPVLFQLSNSINFVV